MCDGKQQTPRKMAPHHISVQGLSSMSREDVGALEESNLGQQHAVLPTAKCNISFTFHTFAINDIPFHLYLYTYLACCITAPLKTHRLLNLLFSSSLSQLSAKNLETTLDFPLPSNSTFILSSQISSPSKFKWTLSISPHLHSITQDQNPFSSLT